MSNIKIIQVDSGLPGKTVVVLAGVHGNEVCGVKAFDKLIPELRLKSGKAYFIYANLEAIKQNKRFVEANLNRCFFEEQPKEMAETLEGKTAKEIMPYLKEADMMLDVHASFTRDSVPFIICGKQSLELAEALPASIISYNWDEFEPGSSDYYLNQQGKICACIECGFIEDEFIQTEAETAILSFLAFANLIDFEEVINTEKQVYEITGIYKNKKSKFKKTRDFSDFETLTKKILIGMEGELEVFGEIGDSLLFVRDREKLNDECFLTARKVALEEAKKYREKYKNAQGVILS